MTYTITCDQCQALVIQGVPCHEWGCPMRGRPWVYDRLTMTCFPGSLHSDHDDDLKDDEPLTEGLDTWT